MKHYFLKEEEFLDEFYDVAGAVASVLGDDWHPNPDCNDAIRRNGQYSLSIGALTRLTFRSAAVFHGMGRGFSHVQITLESSTRRVTLLVKLVGRRLVARKLGDRRLDVAADTR
jgi:hypothetical protein